MSEKREGRVVKVAGPVVVAEGMAGARMYDVVRVGALNLIGEIVELRGDTASIQVYEETTGIGPGEPVLDTEAPLSLELGPGLIESIYDGIQRPLDDLVKVEGQFMSRGSDLPGLNRETKWHFKPVVSKGTQVGPGDIIGEVDETTLVVHRIMVPPGVSGEQPDSKSRIEASREPPTSQSLRACSPDIRISTRRMSRSNRSLCE